MFLNSRFVRLITVHDAKLRKEYGYNDSLKLYFRKETFDPYRHTEQLMDDDMINFLHKKTKVYLKPHFIIHMDNGDEVIRYFDSYDEAFDHAEMYSRQLKLTDISCKDFKYIKHEEK